MGAYDGVKIFFNEDLVKIAKQFDYSLENQLILSDSRDVEIRLATQFPNVYENIKSCRHQRDHRTLMTYARDLVASWLFEDYLLNLLKKTFLITLSGADRTREILPNSKTSTESDYTISKGNLSLKFEVMTDYSNYWNTRKTLDLRDNKFIKLRGTSSFMICVDAMNRSFFIINFRKHVNHKFIPAHPPYGYKPAYKIELSKIDFKNFTIENLINNINEIFLNI